MLWTRICPKHCNDELLLSHLDGELSWARELRVSRHLLRCWECRARLSELEAQAESVALAFADTSFPSPDSIERARRRFAEAEEQYESRLRPVARQAYARSLWPIALTAAVAVCLTVGLWMSRAPRSVEVLATARGAERIWIESQPVLHVRMKVQLSETGPAARRRAGTVEMWSDRGRRRGALRWSDPDGTLRYTVWRPGSGRLHVFQAASQRIAPAPSGAAAWTRLLDQQPTLDRLEAAFLAWLGSHEWRPLEFTDHAARFASAQGVTMHAERTAGASGRPAIRLRIDRIDSPVRAEILLELDAATGRPRFEKVRLSSGARTVELTMTLERSEPLSARELSPRLFEPDHAAAAPAALHVPPPVSRQPEPVAVVPPAPEGPVPSDFDSAQIDAEYAIHHAGICLGGMIQVVREGPASVAVVGRAATGEERTRLLAQLAGVRSFALLRVDVGTLQDQGPPLPSNTAVPAQTFRSPERTPIHDLLERTLGTRAQATAFTNDAVSAADQATTHAWALARLARLYGPMGGRLRPESRWLLETMVSDHLTETTAAATRLEDIFEPLLALGESAGASPEQLQQPPAPWDRVLLDAFESVRAVDRLVQALAAGAGLEDKSVDTSVEELRAGLLRLQAVLRAAPAAVNEEFDPGGQARRPHAADEGRGR